jgi:hypothetical protein
MMIFADLLELLTILHPELRTRSDSKKITFRNHWMNEVRKKMKALSEQMFATMVREKYGIDSTRVTPGRELFRKEKRRLKLWDCE